MQIYLSFSCSSVGLTPRPYKWGAHRPRCRKWRRPAAAEFFWAEVNKLVILTHYSSVIGVCSPVAVILCFLFRCCKNGGKKTAPGKPGQMPGPTGLREAHCNLEGHALFFPRQGSQGMGCKRKSNLDAEFPCAISPQNLSCEPALGYGHS